jgi:CO dehydrogenase nickel-insertion accessory protein CooC1
VAKSRWRAKRVGKHHQQPLGLLVAGEGRRLCIDADPNPTLGQALGVPLGTMTQVVPWLRCETSSQSAPLAARGACAYFRLNLRV